MIPRLYIARGLTLGALLLLALPACDRKRDPGNSSRRHRPSATYDPRSVTTVLGVEAAAVTEAIRLRTDSTAIPTGVSRPRWERVRRLYAMYADAPLWMSRRGVESRADALVAALDSSGSHGLVPSAYYADSVRTAVHGLHGARDATAAQLADADVLLTVAYVAYGSDLLSGRVSPRALSQAWHIGVRESDVDSLLGQTLRTDVMAEGLTALEPQDADYDVLRRELARYRAYAAGGGWRAVPGGALVKPGQRASVKRLDALALRLAAEGLMESAPSRSVADTVYDATLATAVAHFQASHGIEPDSILGPGTVAALNVSAEYRAQQIAANLERLRWLPRLLGPRYVFVNVAAFHLDAFDDGERTLDMNVVVGAEYNNRSTPVFSDTMTTVVFRPYWLVTDSIAAQELWPKQQADPSYFETNNYETYRDGGQTRIRQKPGDRNALGLVKFLFPNDFAIYLHDTPDKALFARANRAASHGCIRVEKPAELAEWVLGWPADRVSAAMHDTTDNQSVPVPRPVPVYIVYLTAYAHDGRLFFGNDVYDRDDPLVKALFGKPSVDPVATVLRAGRAE
jgi:L,D-transpeptidase YcbB